MSSAGSATAPGGAVALAPAGRRAARRLGDELAGGRVGRAIDRLQLDQRRVAVARHRHGAQGGDHARPCPRASRAGALRRGRLPVDQAVGEVAAEDAPALAGRARPRASARSRRRRRSPRRRARCRRGRPRSRESPPRSSRSASRRVSGRRRAARAAGGGRVPCIRRVTGVLDPARAQAHGAVAQAGEAGVVGDEHQRRAAVALQREQQVDDLPAGGLVEVAGGLVGHQDRRVGRDGAGDGDALLLAAGELGRVMVQPVAEADRLQLGRGRARGRRAGRRARAAGPRSPAPSWSARGGRTGTRCRCAGPGSGPARPRRGGRGRCPRSTTPPESGRSSPAMTISSVDLPEPEGPTRPDRLAARDVERDAAQDVDPRRRRGRG